MAQVDCAFVLLLQSQYGISLQYDAEWQRAVLNWREDKRSLVKWRWGKVVLLSDHSLNLSVWGGCSDLEVHWQLTLISALSASLWLFFFSFSPSIRSRQEQSSSICSLPMAGTDKRVPKWLLKGQSWQHTWDGETNAVWYARVQGKWLSSSSSSFYFLTSPDSLWGKKLRWPNKAFYRDKKCLQPWLSNILLSETPLIVK